MSLQVFTEKKDEGVYLIKLIGPLDTETYPTFEKEVELVLREKIKAVILNMEGVNYISSMGIGSVFKLSNAVKGLKGTLLLTNLQPQIKKVFDTVKALPEAIFTSIEEADAYLNEIQKKVLEKEKPA